MKKLLLSILLSSSILAFAQDAQLQKSEDSLKRIANSVKTVEEKGNKYFEIAKLYTGTNREKEIEYLNNAIFEAEQSRNRNLIATTYRKTAEQWLSMPSDIDRQKLAIEAIDKGLVISKDAQQNVETALLLQKKAVAHRYMGKLTEAVKFNEESVNYATLSNDDSVRIVTEMSYANTLLTKDENLAAFKKFMLSLNLAEVHNYDKIKIQLYERIAAFYSKINQKEKAKDYYVKAIDLSKVLKDSINEMYNIQNIILLYAENKEFNIAKQYLKKLQTRVGSNETFKQLAVNAELRILYYEDEKNLSAFFKKNPDVFEDFKKYGMYSEYNRIKGIIFSYENKMDSALFYLNLSKSQINPSDIAKVMSWNSSYALYLEKNKKYLEAAKYLELNLPIAKQVQSLSAEKEIYKSLDSLYIKGGDKQKEVANKLLLFAIKDTLDKQQKANDLLTIEVDLENKRTERDTLAKQEKVRTRNNLQYMGISAAIIALFIGLVALGKLKVKPWLIRSLGFISFILLFEFIILLIDHQLHAITHGEPLPILLVKIVIIAFLLPFHHWLEHKVMAYIMGQKHLHNKTTLV